VCVAYIDTVTAACRYHHRRILLVEPGDGGAPPCPTLVVAQSAFPGGEAEIDCGK
jgi:hypothetical protein